MPAMAVMPSGCRMRELYVPLCTRLVMGRLGEQNRGV